jgi:hypothetical protein
MAYTNPFALINEEIEKITPPVTDTFVEAFQIVRIVKMNIGQPKRVIIDTIMVSEGMENYCRERALTKAEKIGGCMVVEKFEKIIGQY